MIKIAPVFSWKVGECERELGQMVFPAKNNQQLKVKYHFRKKMVCYIPAIFAGSGNEDDNPVGQQTKSEANTYE